MGCGCCITTFQNEVEGEIFSYIKRLKKNDRAKIILIHEIQKDLTQRSATIEKYNYPYRKEDIDKTVDLYKTYIYKEYNGNVDLIEDKLKSKENKKIENKIKEDNKLIINKENKNNNLKEVENNKVVNEMQEEKKINNIMVHKENEIKENKNSKNEKEIINSEIKSDLHPMLETKIKNNSEKDDSNELKEKSIDNIRNFLPKKEEEQNKIEGLKKDVKEADEKKESEKEEKRK